MRGGGALVFTSVFTPRAFFVELPLTHFVLELPLTLALSPCKRRARGEGIFCCRLRALFFIAACAAFLVAACAAGPLPVQVKPHGARGPAGSIKNDLDLALDFSR